MCTGPDLDVVGPLPFFVCNFQRFKYLKILQIIYLITVDILLNF